MRLLSHLATPGDTFGRGILPFSPDSVASSINEQVEYRDCHGLSESLELIYMSVRLRTLPGTWFIKSLVYHSLSLIGSPRERHFLWPATGTGFFFHFQHSKVVILSQVNACVSWCLCKKKAEKIWNSDITSWMPGSQVSTCLGPWLLAPACCTGLLGHSSAAPRAPLLCRMERCVCVSGAGGGSLMLFLPHSLWDTYSFIKVRGESNSKIIWRYWVKVKKKYFGWIYQFLFYFI